MGLEVQGRPPVEVTVELGYERHANVCRLKVVGGKGIQAEGTRYKEI